MSSPIVDASVLMAPWTSAASVLRVALTVAETVASVRSTSSASC
jgi:hypothetical protein